MYNNCVLSIVLNIGISINLTHQQTINCILLILNASYHSELLISSISSLTSKHNMTYPNGCLPTICLLILLILSFSSLVYHNNSLNSIILPFIYLTLSYSCRLILLAMLVLSSLSLLYVICSTYLCKFLNIFLNHAFTIFEIKSSDQI